MATKIPDARKQPAVYQEGESSNFTLVFKDFDGTAITKANLSSLTLTLYDKTSNAILNSRSAQNVIDVNGGTVATDGTLTMRLDASDNTYETASPSVGDKETHVAKFTWQWNDGTQTRTGIEEYEFEVQKMAAPT